MSNDHGGPHFHQEEDQIKTPTILTVGIAALIAFAIGIGWAVQIQRSYNGALTQDVTHRRGQAGQGEIGMVYQHVFGTTQYAAELNGPKRKLLEEYGWGDPAHQTVRIPIERAMDLVVERGKL